MQTLIISSHLYSLVHGTLRFFPVLIFMILQHAYWIFCDVLNKLAHIVSILAEYPVIVVLN